jgi:AsmA protein
MKRSTIIVAGLVIFVVAAGVLIPLIINAKKIRPALEKQLSIALGRAVRVGDLSFPPFSASLVASNVSIADDPSFSSTPFLTAKGVRIAVYLAPLILRREVKLRGFQIQSPQINLIRASEGTWNFSSIGHAAAGAGTENSKISLSSLPDLSVSRILIKDSRVVIATLPAHGEPTIYERVNLSARDFSFASQFSFELDANLPAGGTLSATGRLGPINRSDAAASPCDAHLSVKNLDPVEAGFLDPNAGIALLADFDVHAVSEGQALSTNGTAHLQNLKLGKGATPAPKPVDLAFTSTHRLKENTGEIQDASLKIGDAAIHVTGTYQIVQMVVKDADLNLKITGQTLPIDDLQMLMAAAGVRLPNGSVLKGGTLSLNLVVTGEEKSLLIFGTVAAEKTRLVGFDVGSKIHGIAALSGVETGDTTDFKKLQMFIRDTNSGVTVDKIDAVIPAMGKLTGGGRISPDHELNFRLLVIGVKTKGIGKVGVGIMSMFRFSGSSGSTSVPMRITGTTEEPSITADVGGVFQKQAKWVRYLHQKIPQ